MSILRKKVTNNNSSNVNSNTGNNAGRLPHINSSASLAQQFPVSKR